MNNNQLLSRTECSILRGLAILGIFLHNYCHWLNPIVKENEYQYIQHNVDWFTQVLLHPDTNLPIHLLSFFGHYGVPVFLFLSAYGLVMKYEKSEKYTTLPGVLSAGKVYGPSFFSFVRYHFLKLFKMMIVGFVAFTMIDQIVPSPHHYEVLDVIAQLGLFNNVLPNPDGIIWPGPYWFFGLMLQLYIVYRLFLYRRSWVITVLFILGCWLLQAFCDPEGETLNRIRYNFMGGMLPFGMGILYARYCKDTSNQLYATLAFVSLCLIWAFSFNYQLWFWVPAFICTFSIGLVKVMSALGRHLSLFNRINIGINWIGAISAALFVCHPITRKIFIPISRHGDIYTGLLLYIIASLCLAWLFKKFMDQIPSPKLK